MKENAGASGRLGNVVFSCLHLSHLWPLSSTVPALQSKSTQGENLPINVFSTCSLCRSGTHPNVESVRLEHQKWDYLLMEVLDRDLWYFVNTTGKCLRNEWRERGWQLHGSIEEEPNATLIVSTGLRWHVLAWHFLGTAAAVVPSLSLFLFYIFSSQLFSPLLSGFWGLVRGEC